MRDTMIMRAEASDRGAELTFSTPVAVIDVPGLIDFAVAHRSDRFAVLARSPGTRGVFVDLISGWMSLVPAPAPRR
jgi:hypothetical protein